MAGKKRNSAKKKGAAKTPTLSVSERALRKATSARWRADHEYRLALTRVRREQVRKAAAREPGPSHVGGILAEGDSWFRYDCGFGVIHYLAWELRGKATFVNLAGSGATLRSMLHMPGRQGFENCLRKGFQERHPWYAVLFSGGGNDICDKDFGAWLVPYRQGMSPRDAIDASTWEPKMREVMDLYALLAGLVGELAGETKVFVNLYDFATPNNVGVGPVGPWLAPGFKEKHYPADLDFRRAVVKILLEDFAARLRTVAASHPNLQIVPTQGILAEDEWANELHPTNPGFEKISRVFRAALGF